MEGVRRVPVVSLRDSAVRGFRQFTRQQALAVARSSLHL